MTDKTKKDFCRDCSVEPPAMRFKCPECEHNPDKEIFAKDINVPHKEQTKCKYKIQDDYHFNGKPYCTCFCELCEDLPICVHNCQIFEDYKQLQKEKFENLNNRQIVEDAENLIYENSELYKNLKEKEQECEKLEDFRTLTRGVFTFGDSDVDDENFIKYLQEYSRSYEEAIDRYYRLTDITGINYTVHGGADIEEIIKRVDILKHECEELKKKLRELELKNTTLQNRYQQLNGSMAKADCYREALEEIEAAIETYSSKHQYSIANDLYNQILDIINKTKEIE